MAERPATRRQDSNLRLTHPTSASSELYDSPAALRREVNNRHPLLNIRTDYATATDVKAVMHVKVCQYLPEILANVSLGS